jgi:hypothetical protein
LQQAADHLQTHVRGLATLDRCHERQVLIGVGAVLEEHLHDLGPTVLDGRAEQAIAPVEDRVRIRSGVQRTASQPGISLANGREQILPGFQLPAQITLKPPIYEHVPDPRCHNAEQEAERGEQQEKLTQAELQESQLLSRRLLATLSRHKLVSSFTLEAPGTRYCSVRTAGDSRYAIPRPPTSGIVLLPALLDFL